MIQSQSINSSAHVSPLAHLATAWHSQNTHDVRWAEAFVLTINKLSVAFNQCEPLGFWIFHSTWYIPYSLTTPFENLNEYVQHVFLFTHRGSWDHRGVYRWKLYSAKRVRVVFHILQATNGPFETAAGFGVSTLLNFQWTVAHMWLLAHSLGLLASVNGAHDWSCESP